MRAQPLELGDVAREGIARQVGGCRRPAAAALNVQDDFAPRRQRRIGAQIAVPRRRAAVKNDDGDAAASAVAPKIDAPVGAGGETVGERDRRIL